MKGQPALCPEPEKQVLEESRVVDWRCDGESGWAGRGFTLESKPHPSYACLREGIQYFKVNYPFWRSTSIRARRLIRFTYSNLENVNESR